MIKIYATANGIDQEVDFDGTSDELLAILGKAGITVNRADASKPIEELRLVFVNVGDSIVTHHLNSAGTAVVSDDVFWKPIDANTPRGVSMWLINRAAGVSQKGKYDSHNDFYTHWFPNPKFKKETT